MAVQNPGTNPPPTTFGDGISAVSSLLKTTGITIDNGVDAVAGTSKTVTLSVLGTWATNDLGQVIITDSATGVSYVMGDGFVTGVQPAYGLTLKEKVYVIAGGVLYFCEIGDPTEWDDVTGLGNGFINLSLGYALPENLVAIAAYQGKIAIFGKEATQIYNLATDPADYSQQQVLPNLGSIAAETVKSLGNLDVLMLSYNGIRSLRVRDSSLNAMTVDIGSPIDSVIVDKLRASSATQIAAACAVVDPDSGRYWLFLKDTIYVLSYFESAQVIAWSTYLPQSEELFIVEPTVEHTEDGIKTLEYLVTVGQAYVLTVISGSLTFTNGVTSFTATAGSYYVVATASPIEISYPVASIPSFNFKTPTLTSFVPYRFETFKGLVYARTSTAIVLYGGTNGNTYDSAVATWETPWLSNKEPATRKLARAIGLTYSGRWNVYCGLDFKSETLDFVMQTNDAELGTMEEGVISYSAEGTHFKFKGQTADSDAATLSAFILHYKKGDQR